ncbi:MAG: tetratricopeptide repeat protein, partial [marine benthic group bacterium]|nr:tetratricopeptide repeat protein [Gemmatimonadota bacterium]
MQAQEVGSGSSESRSLARAATAERAGRVEEARRELEAVLDVNPTSSAALAMLSQLLTTRGRSSEVLQRAESAAAAGGLGDPVVMQVWIRALDSAGQRDSALSLATDWIRRKPTDVAAYAER